ncbi:LysR family transcriptional regulator [Neiella sp. HB171785]|uniref:LysR family transcriptional regulator n=1 Tax=Neiella litorisoli TaxID=2771431 RepID=A0A8J6QKA3_9GAMM|nr:LysR family transcriptional regulator [Neiella litorisoli]MBD1389771.1 LysR family transcriptional regulator [Neiella litorisoli]
MLNPLYLRTFCQLVETKNFTRTAEALFMTQPGVTQHIKRLEEAVGQPLLNRFGKQFELTIAGEQLHRYALQQQVAEQELMSAMQHDRDDAGECRLACSGAVALRLYPALLALQQRQPKLSFYLEAAPAGRIIERLKFGDIAVGICSEQVNDATIKQQSFANDELCLVLPQATQLSWQALIELGFINHPDGHHFAASVLQANFADQFAGMAAIPERGYVNQIGQILTPVALGLGFTVLPRSAVASATAGGQLKVAALQQPVYQTLYWTEKRHKPLAKRYGRVFDTVKQLLN